MKRRPWSGRVGQAALLCGALLLSGCGGGSGRQESTKLGPRVVQLGQPVPKGGGRYKVGSPYRLNGRLYVPEEVRHYDRRGIASWYGEMFHGRRTANGEIYNMEALTAAHPTLPMPSLARVTNLENGRSMVVRVNDRGPYVAGRTIDLSWAVASLLQVHVAGTAPVRIQYLGPAPLSGNDRYERQVLADQPWAGPQVAFAPSPAKAMRYRRTASAPIFDDDEDDDDGSVRVGASLSKPTASRAPAGAEFGVRLQGEIGAEQPRRTAALPSAVKAEAPGRGRIPADFLTRVSGTAAPVRLAAAAPEASAEPAPRRRTTPGGAKAQRQRPAYVEAGLFPDQRLAERLASTLTDLAPVTVEPEAVGGATLHRLRVGPFATLTQAEAAVARMRAAGLTGAYLQPVPGG